MPNFCSKICPIGLIDITTPQIYFGERTNGYVIVRTEQAEFDYPAEAGNVFTRFEADTGIPIGGWLNRLVFALRFGDINFLLTDAIMPESKLLWRRLITAAVEEVAPFLHFDE